MTNYPTHGRDELTYDGFGINGPDEYRSRICYFMGLENAEKYGPLFAAAPKLLANLKTTTDLAERYGAGNDCDGNLIEAHELIATLEKKAR